MTQHPEIYLESALRKELTATGLSHPTYAVVVPLIFKAQEPELLIEVRAPGISQPGDPCFPGGRIDPGETPQEAAARELYEELGLFADPKEFLGQLPTVFTPLGSKTNVYVTAISPEALKHLNPNRDEVAEVLLVPLSVFLSQPERRDFPVDGHVIWGMTAGTIRNFCAAYFRATGDSASKA